MTARWTITQVSRIYDGETFRVWKVLSPEGIDCGKYADFANAIKLAQAWALAEAVADNRLTFRKIIAKEWPDMHRDLLTEDLRQVLGGNYLAGGDFNDE